MTLAGLKAVIYIYYTNLKKQSILLDANFFTWLEFPFKHQLGSHWLFVELLRVWKSSEKLMLFFFLKGVLAESLGEDSNDNVFTLMEGMVDTGKNVGSSGACEDLVADDEGERSMASVEDQLRKEMTVYEVREICQ